MKFFGLAILIGSVLTLGCSKNAAGDFEKLADRACECALEDTACGNKVLADVAKFTENTKTSTGDMHRINEAGKRMYDCLNNSGVKPTELTAALEKLVE